MFEYIFAFIIILFQFIQIVLLCMWANEHVLLMSILKHNVIEIKKKLH
jgi:hypothetical protein